MLHEIMATPPAAQAGQDGSLDMATRVPLGTTGIVPPAEWPATIVGSVQFVISAMAWHGMAWHHQQGVMFADPAVQTNM